MDRNGGRRRIAINQSEKLEVMNPMKTRCQSIFRAAYHTFDRAVFAGAVLLIASSTQAQNLFVSGYGSGNIYEFTPSGAQSTFASGLTPGGLAFNSTGDLFDADPNSGNVYEFTPSGVRSTFASGLSYPQGLAFNSAGNLFVAESYFSDNIYEFTPSGAQSTFASGLSSPAILLVEWPLTVRVICLSRITTAATFMNTRPPEHEAFLPPGCPEHTALAFNSAGDLFETDQQSGNIYEFTPNGTRSTFASGLRFPIGLAFNNAGDLFVTTDDSTIREFTTDGVESTFASGLNLPTELAFQPVPEPSVLGLLAIGVTALLVRRRCNLAT